MLVGAAPADEAAARRVALAASVDTVLTLHSTDRSSLVERAAALRDARADAVLIVADDGASDLAEAARLAYGGVAHPLVLVAGSDRPRDRIVASLSDLAAEPLPAVATPYGRDALVARLRAMRREVVDEKLPDERVEAQARDLAITSRRGVVVLDVGSATTMLAFAAADGASFALTEPVGVGERADRVVARSGIDRVRRWIPRAIDAPALLDRVFNRTRWPDAAPSTPLTLSIEMALAREAVAMLLAEAERAGVDLAPLRSAKTVVCRGVLARWPRAQQCVMVALDALGSDGVHVIARDVDGAVRPLAVVASVWPKRSLTISVQDASGTVDERVSRGAFLLVPTRGAVELRAGGTTQATASDLEVGVVIDARGRPLTLPPRDAERLPTLARWTTALGVAEAAT